MNKAKIIKQLKLEKDKLYCNHNKDKVCKSCLSNISGNVTGISGNVSGISGNVTRILGDVSGISGDVTRILGDVSGISGDVSGILGGAKDIIKILKREMR